MTITMSEEEYDKRTAEIISLRADVAKLRRLLQERVELGDDEAIDALAESHRTAPDRPATPPWPNALGPKS